MLKGKLAINETDPQMFAYFLVADNLKCIIGKLNHIILSENKCSSNFNQTFYLLGPKFQSHISIARPYPVLH